MDVESTLEAVRTWPVDDQLRLVFEVWDRIVADGWQPRLSEELRAELNRRLAAHQAEPSRALTWEQVLAHVKRVR
jgi:putative addiction module component (TIGR02574 family)